MSAATAHKPIVHFVGSIPLPDAETVFRTLAAATGPHLKRLPDGETGIRKTWIRFLQQVLADNPAIEVANDVPPFKFTKAGLDQFATDSLLEGTGFEPSVPPSGLNPLSRDNRREWSRGALDDLFAIISP